MKIITVSYGARAPSFYPVGYRGDHNAALLRIVPPDAMAGADFYRLDFRMPDGSRHSSEDLHPADGVLPFPVTSALTAQAGRVTLQLKAFRRDGANIVWQASAPCVYLTVGESEEGGTPAPERWDALAKAVAGALDAAEKAEAAADALNAVEFSLKDDRLTVRQGERERDLGRVRGESAYETWLARGNTGTEADFLASLKGEPGPRNAAELPTAGGGNVQAELDRLFAEKANLTPFLPNLAHTADLAGILPIRDAWPETDPEAGEALCPPLPFTYTYQRYRVRLRQGHRYLFTAKVRGVSGSEVKIELFVRYPDSAQALPTEYVPGLPRYVEGTPPFGPVRLGVMGTVTDSALEFADFTLALTHPGQDVTWGYGEVMILDVTGLGEDEIGHIVSRGYFREAALRNVAEDLTESLKAKLAAQFRTFPLDRWRGKKVLCLGDSLTAAGIWQRKLEELLGMQVSTRAKGGIPLKALAEGAGDLPPLTAADVADRDLILIFAGYNNRHNPAGKIGDRYPEQDTVAGQLQYVIDTVYERLGEAGNPFCTVAVITPHCAGKYAHIPHDGYEEYPPGSGQTLKTLAETMERVARHNALPCLNAFETSGINRHTWRYYAAAADPGPDDAPNDQLHLNAERGYPHLGTVIARFVAGL